METRAIAGGETKFAFSYSVTTSNGRLTGITDEAGGKIKVPKINQLNYYFDLSSIFFLK